MASQLSSRRVASPARSQSPGRGKAEPSMEQLMAKLQDLEKFKAEEEKGRKKQEGQQKKDLAAAKKKLTKEIATTRGALKKNLQNEGKLKQSLLKLEQSKTVVAQKKDAQVKKVDQDLQKTEKKQLDTQVELQTKIGAIAEAKGTLAYLTAAQQLLDKGIDVTQIPREAVAKALDVSLSQIPELANAADEEEADAALREEALSEASQRALELSEMKAEYERVREEAKEMRLMLERECDEREEAAKLEIEHLHRDLDLMREENEAVRGKLENANRTVVLQAEQIEDLLARLAAYEKQDASTSTRASLVAPQELVAPPRAARSSVITHEMPMSRASLSNHALAAQQEHLAARSLVPTNDEHVSSSGVGSQNSSGSADDRRRSPAAAVEPRRSRDDLTGTVDEQDGPHAESPGLKDDVRGRGRSHLAFEAPPGSDNADDVRSLPPASVSLASRASTESGREAATTDHEPRHSNAERVSLASHALAAQDNALAQIAASNDTRQSLQARPSRAPQVADADTPDDQQRRSMSARHSRTPQTAGGPAGFAVTSDEHLGSSLLGRASVAPEAIQIQGGSVNDLLRQSLSARASFTSAAPGCQFAEVSDDLLRQSLSARASLVSRAPLAHDGAAVGADAQARNSRFLDASPEVGNSNGSSSTADGAVGEFGESLPARPAARSSDRLGVIAPGADNSLRRSSPAIDDRPTEVGLVGGPNGAAQRAAVPARMSVSVHALAMQEPEASNLDESPAASSSARGLLTPTGNALVAAWQPGAQRHLDASRTDAAVDPPGVARLSASPQRTDVRVLQQATDDPRGLAFQASLIKQADTVVTQGGVGPQAPAWQAVVPQRLDAAQLTLADQRPDARQSAAPRYLDGSVAQPADLRAPAWQAASPRRHEAAWPPLADAQAAARQPASLQYPDGPAGQPADLQAPAWQGSPPQHLDAVQPAFADPRVATRHAVQPPDAGAVQPGMELRTPRQGSSAMSDASGIRSGAVSPNVPLRLASGVATPLRLAEGMGCQLVQSGPHQQLPASAAWGPPGQTGPGLGMLQISSALPQQQPPTNPAYQRTARMPAATPQDDAHSAYSSGSSSAMAAMGRPIGDGRASSTPRVRALGAEVARSTSPMPRVVVMPGATQRNAFGGANFPMDASSRHTLPAAYNAYGAPPGAPQRQTSHTPDGRQTLPAGAHWPGMPCAVRAQAAAARPATRGVEPLGSPSVPSPWAPARAMPTEPLAFAAAAPRQNADEAAASLGGLTAAEARTLDLGRETSPTRMGFKEAVHKVAARALREFKQNHRRTLTGEDVGEGPHVFSSK